MFLVRLIIAIIVIFTDSSLGKGNESALIDIRNVDDRVPVVRNAAKTKISNHCEAHCFPKELINDHVLLLFGCDCGRGSKYVVDGARMLFPEIVGQHVYL